MLILNVKLKVGVLKNTIAISTLIAIHGMKHTPPRRGTTTLCTLRALGISYSFFFIQKDTIIGMNISPQSRLTVKEAIKQKEDKFIFTYLYYYIQLFTHAIT